MSVKKQNQKYKPLYPFCLESRQWPNKTLSTPPIWCSVDLRDGNQALINPMSLNQKIELFNYLVSIGFKHIEVGFPAASSIEFEFVRYIIEKNLIPNDVSIQVLTQAREHLIKQTLKSIEGASNAIVHLYNSTSIAQRKYVFNMSKDNIIQLACQGIHWIKKYINKHHKNIMLEYSPESFTGTEIEFSLQVCNEVINSWDISAPIIINLPATVELFMPHIYADMIEYCSLNLNNRKNIILSVHTHNDRGTCTAATELALLAGADRVEGTLFGNGERTGNLDITTVALNLYMVGINPQLDLTDLNKMEDIYTRCTGMTIHPRHPYAGELVFTAFSGSHQDAIKKGMSQYKKELPWDIPYLTIDPADISKKYEAIIRINSQSGKGGVAYILEKEYNCTLPKTLQTEVSFFIQKKAEKTGLEITPKEIWHTFNTEFINRNDIVELLHIQTELTPKGTVNAHLTVGYKGKKEELFSSGNGPIDAAKKALETLLFPIKLLSYSEHSLSQGSDSNAISYIQIMIKERSCHGVGIDSNISISSIKALFSAINRNISEN